MDSRDINLIAYKAIKELNDLGWLKKIFENNKEIHNFIKFSKIFIPQDANSFTRIANLWGIKDGLSLVSACCLHTNEGRDGVVQCLSPNLIDLIKKTSETALDPKSVKKWTIYTFGPGDSYFIQKAGLSEILLPFMQNMNNNQMEAVLDQQYSLTDGLVEKLKEAGFNMELKSLSDLASRVSDLDSIFIKAELKSKEMVEKFRKGEIPSPKIFQILSLKEQEIRCAKEAVLYLLLTEAHSLDAVYVGFEVHGGYWTAGDLNQIDEKFLSLCWPHPVINQHWGLWAEQQKLPLISNQRKFLKKIKAVFS